MNILFLTIGRFDSISQTGIYPDLLRCFVKDGHNVFTVSSREKRLNLPTELFDEGKAKTLKVRIGNITKTGLIEKGISTLLVEHQYISAIKKYFRDVKFDLVLYSTPPITFAKCIQYIKKRDNARTYLMLKDIFPQNAVDLGMMSKSGLKGFLYRFFRRKEEKLYELSDKIGCMSQANVEYVIANNPKLDPGKVEICPNAIEVLDLRLNEAERMKMREKYEIPTDRKVLVYGGNLGKPQGIPFIIECLKTLKERQDIFFLIVGDGTEFNKLASFVDAEKPQNVKLMKRLPKDDYDRMVSACDVGLIFLDHRFTIPNFPSRLLAYMQAGLPVLAATDPNTDIGKVAVEGGFGWWCESNDASAFGKCVDLALNSDLKAMGTAGFEYLKKNYSADRCYEIVMNLLKEASV